MGGAEIYGGAITSWTSNITAYNNTFDNNFGLRAGAIGPNCWDGFICAFKYENIVFSNNWAIQAGGAYFYPKFRPNFVNCTFVNNSA